MKSQHPGQEPRPAFAPERVAILLFEGVEPLDYQGPCQMFDLWRAEFGGPEIVTVGSTGRPVKCAYGRMHQPQLRFADCPPFEALVVPGGPGRKLAAGDPQFMDFLRVRGQGCEHILSVCTGVFLLEGAGLLGRRRVTTHWEFLDELKAIPSLRVSGERRVVRDGNVWTAAGICAGLDLALAFIDAFQCTPRKDGSLRSGEAGMIQSIAQLFPIEEAYQPGDRFQDLPDFIQAHFHGRGRPGSLGTPR